MSAKIKLLLAMLIAVFPQLVTMGQKQFTLEDLCYGGNRYYQMAPERRYYQWWGDELVRLTTDEAFTIDKASGKEKPLLSFDDISAALDDSITVGMNMLRATFPVAGKPYILVTAKKQRYLVDWKTRKILWQRPEEGLLEWNGKSNTDAFLDNNNLCLRLADGTVRRLTDDGSREIVYGQSVHRNEFGISKGTFFSQDGTKLAFYRMDQTMVTDYPQVNTFGASDEERIAEYTPDKYPMTGMTSHKVTVGIHDIAANKTVYLNVGDPTDRYFTNISWAPDGKRLYLIELNRDQNIATLDEYDALTGEKLRTLDTEKDEKYVQPMNPITFLPWDSDRFLFWSQKDGFMHLYLYSNKDGKCLRQLTKGNFVIQELVGFCTEKRIAIVKANKENPLSHNLYALNIETGVMQRIDGGEGVHNATLSASGAYLIDLWSAPSMPRAYDLLTVAKVKQKTLFNSRNPWEGYGIPAITTGTLKAADGVTDLYYRLTLPPGFDPATAKEKIPAIVYVYGGPVAHCIDASWNWGARPFDIYMAQKGFAVFTVDNRGSELRGKDFEQVTFRQLGQEEMRDQIKGVEYLTSLPYIDKERLGLHGWSFGGFMTTSLMTNYPDVFKAAVAGGPVMDWKYYEVMYGERYMDTPQTNPEGYAKTSLLDKAKNLKGKLLIVTGMNDDVVVPQNALQFLKACNVAGKLVDFYPYPGYGHHVLGHEGVYLYERMTNYLIENIK